MLGQGRGRGRGGSGRYDETRLANMVVLLHKLFNKDRLHPFLVRVYLPDARLHHSHRSKRLMDEDTFAPSDFLNRP